MIHELPIITIQHDWQIHLDKVLTNQQQQQQQQHLWISVYPHTLVSDTLPIHSSIKLVVNKNSTEHLIVGVPATISSDRLVSFLQFKVLSMCKAWLSITNTLPNIACTVIAPSQSIPRPNINPKLNPITAIAYSPSGKLLVVGDTTGQVLILDNADGSVNRTMTGHCSTVNCVLFFPSGQVVLSASADFCIRIWSILDGSCPRILTGHTRPVTHCAIFGRATSLDCTARVWLCASGESEVVLQLDIPVNTVELLSIVEYAPHRFTKPPLFDTDSLDPYIAVFGLASGTVVGISLAAQDHEFTLLYPCPVNTLAIINGGVLAAGYEDGCLIVWDLQLGQIQHQVQVFKTAITQVRRFTTTQSKHSVLVSSADGLVQVISWTSDHHQPEISHILTGFDLDPVNGLDVYNSCNVVACGRDGLVKIYNC